MSDTIYKYEIDPEWAATEMPKGAEILTVAAQGSGIYVWARVDSDAPKELRYFYVIGTGHSIDVPHLTYIGTAHMPDVGLVLHVFEAS